MQRITFWFAAHTAVSVALGAVVAVSRDGDWATVMGLALMAVGTGVLLLQAAGE